MRQYGMPYKGSKSKIAEWVVDVLPPADNLIDLFAGERAVSHCALFSHKWNKIIANDIEPGLTQGNRTKTVERIYEPRKI